MLALFSAIWRYRQFVISSIRTDFRSRFTRSKLGALWAVLQPLAQALIFSIMLSEVLGARLANVDNKIGYAAYVMSGMAAWGLFSEIVMRCTTIFIEHAGSLKKIAFPRICLPLIVWGGALVNHLLLLSVMAIVFVLFGYPLRPEWLVLPIGMVLISMFAFGLGVTLGILNTFTRDIGHVFNVVMQIWFWITPIVYTANTPPQEWRWIIDLNPMVPLIQIYQGAITTGKVPDLGTLMAPTILGVALLSLSFLMFRRASPELVDAL